MVWNYSNVYVEVIIGSVNIMNKWIDLSGLPMWGNGSYKGINWKESIGCKCKFKYNDIEGEVEIVDYNKKTGKLTIKYLDYDLFEIFTNSFKMCRLGCVLKKRTNEFKAKIGQVFKDNKRDLTVINREYKKDKSGIERKYYKYHCNKCGNEDWMLESGLLNGIGCNICCNRIAKLGFNTIYDTDKWMIDLGVSKEDGKKYTSRSGQKIKVKCPYCGKEKEIRIYSIYTYKSIGCSCSDGISYPEKFIISLLDQLNIKYETQYSPEWIKPKRYDFYFELNDKKYIIEVNGEQHYKYTGFNRTLNKEQENDRYKKELALKNEIDTYIELDCRESDKNYIKNSIVNSELNKIFDLSQINWLQCEEFALSNIIKEICDYWRVHNEINNEELTPKELSKIFNLNRHTITNYLNKGNNLGWCSYNGKEEMSKNGSNNGKKNSKTKIEMFNKNGILLGVFENAYELSINSENLFGVKLKNDNITRVCRGERKTYKGYTFRYINVFI